MKHNKYRRQLLWKQKTNGFTRQREFQEMEKLLNGRQQTEKSCEGEKEKGASSTQTTAMVGSPE